MLCELCKKEKVHKNMSLALYDTNGVTYIDLCKSCARRLKFAIKSKYPQHFALYPEKEEKCESNKARLL